MSDLTRPSTSLVERAVLESRMIRLLTGIYTTFVNEVRQDAQDAFENDALVAAAPDHSFTYTRVMTRWRAAVAVLADTRPSTPTKVLRLMERADIPRQLYSEVRDVLLTARTMGWSNYWTKVQLGKKVVPLSPEGVSRELYRASIERIARTAATYEHGMSVKERAQKQDFTHLRWVARMDRFTRPTHLEANGQTVAMDEPFLVAGYYLDAPGDPSAPPAVSANCRCTLIAVRLTSSPESPDGATLEP